jgi:adenine-specific DNA methylase
MTQSPKRLIEVDLPIKRISEHARREKDMRRGHVPLLYIWPATRPPAACRAVLCAALWPDPADSFCPQDFRDKAAQLINNFARSAASEKDVAAHCSPETWEKWQRLASSSGLDATKEAHWNVLRFALLDFIADFANYDNSTISVYLETSRALTQAAHEALGGALGTKPLVADPFAGGGAIPLEALRIGADAFASELNPVAVLYEKMLLEYIPRYGTELARQLITWVDWAKGRAKDELAKFYPEDPSGMPIVYLWARTVICEGPACGTKVPLIRGLWLARKGDSVALRLIPRKDSKKVDFEIIENPKPKEVGEGTVKRGAAICPVCGYTTPAPRVRLQLKEHQGGAATAVLFCVVTIKETEKGRSYRLPTERDLRAVTSATEELKRLEKINKEDLPLVPNEVLPIMSGVFNAPLYGHITWGSLFAPRQALMLATFARLARDYVDSDGSNTTSVSKDALACTLGLFINRLADLNSSLCGWQLSTPNAAHVFVRWALPMIMDFAEVNPLAGAGGSPESVVRRMVAAIEYVTESGLKLGSVELASATRLPLPDDSVHIFMTDPPYYNAVPYADLSDFFYVWLKRSIRHQFPSLLGSPLSPKEEEICEMAGWDPVRYPQKDKNFFEREMGKAMAEGRRVLASNGIAVVVFAHKSTSGWEALLQAMVNAGWTITASWPIDTEMASRLRARNSAVLASSVHLVCRPRGNHRASVAEENLGDWRDVLTELPLRIRDWMPRLASEGIVGADAIFACLGPALEIFSRYSSVEKASGEEVTLKEYLEYVWAAVAKEALNRIFEGADATGFEEDARLTAMWLWTLSTGSSGNGAPDDEDEGEEEEETSGKKGKTGGFLLEYDAARKIAQGLGAHLERLTSLVEISGDKARLLPVSERARHLFGKEEGDAPTKRKAKSKQLSFSDFLEDVEQSEGGWGAKNAPKIGNTVLDRVHQSMILFAAGRNDAMKRFLVSDGTGQDQRFWRLAQALSALYPSGSDERRWVEGVMARKKGMGF